MTDRDWYRLTVVGQGNPDDIGRGGVHEFAKRAALLGFTVIDSVDLRKASERPKWPDEQWLKYRISDLKASLAREEAEGRNTALVHAARRMIRFLEDREEEMDRERLKKTAQDSREGFSQAAKEAQEKYVEAALSNDLSNEIRKMSLPHQMRIAATILVDVTEAIYPDINPEKTGWDPEALRSQAAGMEAEEDDKRQARTRLASDISRAWNETGILPNITAIASELVDKGWRFSDGQ